MENLDQPKRGRQPKSETVPAKRRRKKGSNGVMAAKLSLPEFAKDDTGYTYRWVNDVKNRIHALTAEDDWEMVSSKNGAIISSRDEALKRPVGTQESGEPMFAYLLKKPTEFVQEDHQEAQGRIDDKMKQIRKGAQGADRSELHTHGYNPTTDTIRGLK